MTQEPFNFDQLVSLFASLSALTQDLVLRELVSAERDLVKELDAGPESQEVKTDLQNDLDLVRMAIRAIEQARDEYRNLFVKDSHVTA